MNEVPLSEHSTVLLAIHTAMRADSQRLVGAVDALPEGDTARASALGEAFGVVTRLIHDHHWTEDDVMYPFLLEHVDGFEDEAVGLEDDHVDLDAGMARISARLRLLAHQVSPRIWEDTRHRLVDDVATFKDVLLRHLDREESIVVPAVDSALSPDDQRALEKEESKLTTYRHMSTAIPWVLANVAPEEEARFRALIPKLLNVVQDHLWDRQLRRQLAPLYDAVP